MVFFETPVEEEPGSQPEQDNGDDDDERGNVVLPVGNRARCPECGKTYKNAYTCRRHMKQQHLITDDKTLNSVGQTREPCRFCNK